MTEREERKTDKLARLVREAVFRATYDVPRNDGTPWDIARRGADAVADAAVAGLRSCPEKP